MGRYLVVVTGVGPFCSLYAEDFAAAERYAAEVLGPSGWCVGTVGYSVEVTSGEWHGVPLPSWLRAFDCRISDADVAPKTPDGRTLWSSERAEEDLGLRNGKTWPDSATPLSCQTYVDARTADEAELARQVRDMVKSATELRDAWLASKADPAPAGQGGGVDYQPVAVAMTNYGWSVICDRRTAAVRR